jgi:hypothetical protein
MHPTADTHLVMYIESLGAAGDARVMLLRSELLSEHAKRDALLPRGVAKIENEVEGAA